VDTAPIIYGIEKNPNFAALLLPLWQAAQAGQLTLTTSALTLFETLVLPLKQNDALLIAAYERALTAADTQLLPITNEILRQAAALRAQFNLKTPDAIHAASGLSSCCTNCFELLSARQPVGKPAIFRQVS
jgi:predicted nucleic acid-binding protein